MEVCLSKYHGCLVGSMETLNFFEIYSFKYPGCLVGTTDLDSRFLIFENDGSLVGSMETSNEKFFLYELVFRREHFK